MARVPVGAQLDMAWDEIVRLKARIVELEEIAEQITYPAMHFYPSDRDEDAFGCNTFGRVRGARKAMGLNTETGERPI